MNSNSIKKIIVYWMIVFILVAGYSPLFCEGEKDLSESELIPEVYGDHFLLVFEDTDQVLYESNAHERIYPASTTKMMTALIVLENVDNLDEIVNVDSESPFVGGSAIFIDVNEKISVRNLLHGMLISSGNDAASALAIHVAGSTEKFAELMNAKAEELGCEDTHFVNPHGLHDPDHYTTVSDLYLIAKEGMKNEVFREIVGKGNYDIPPTNEQPEIRHLYSTNALLENGYGSLEVIEDLYGNAVQTAYPYAIGIKTGYTEEAGKCLVSAANSGSRTVYSIIVKSDAEHIFEDSAQMLEYGLFSFQSYEVLEQGQVVKTVDLEDREKNVISLVAKTPLNAMLKTAPNKGDIKLNVRVDDFVLPVMAGQTLGTAEAFYNGVPIGRVDICSDVDITGKELLDNEVYREKKRITIDYVAWIVRIITVFFLFVVITIAAYFLGLHPNSPKRRRNRGKRVG